MEPAGGPGPGGSGWSGAVRVADVSDYLAPAPACVVAADPAGAPPSPPGGLGGGLVLQPRAAAARGGAGEARAAGEEAMAPKPEGEAKVKIALTDCLACAGCVTSAETVLLEHQSVAELLERLRGGAERAADVVVVVTVSLQSAVALAHRYGLPPGEARARLAHVLRGLGVRAVLDDASGRDLALLEAAHDFVGRYRRHAAGAAGQLPMLTSECPGWVLYAEKTQGAYLLPHLATAKSAQGVMGTLVKRRVARRLGVPAGRVYHCAVMPCYDKKLEAARGDLTVEAPDRAGARAPEVDSVLTTGEVQALLDERGVDLRRVPPGRLDALVDPDEAAAAAAAAGPAGAAPGPEGSSGGYLHFVLREAARELFGQAVAAGPLPLVAKRSADFQEVALHDAAGNVLLKFALAYGFRNIQNIVRRVKQGRLEYHFVEVMACPAGCLNGGGQPKPGPDQTAKELAGELEQVFREAYAPRHPLANPEAQAVHRQWLGGPGGEVARDVLHMGFRDRKKGSQGGAVGTVAVAAASDW